MRNGLWIVIFELLLLGCGATAQQDRTSVCWREDNPGIPGDWSRYGFVVEDSNRFKVIPGVKLQLFWNDGTLPDTNMILIREVTSDARGFFDFGRIPAGNFRIRATLSGRQPAVARGAGNLAPQWVGRGLRVALAPVGQGCSRIWRANADDADCGSLDCGQLPRGTVRMIYSDGRPIARTRFNGFEPSRKSERWRTQVTFITDSRGVAHTEHIRGCYMFSTTGANRAAAHLCFTADASDQTIDVSVPPRASPFNR